MLHTLKYIQDKIKYTEFTPQGIWEWKSSSSQTEHDKTLLIRILKNLSNLKYDDCFEYHLNTRNVLLEKEFLFNSLYISMEVEVLLRQFYTHKIFSFDKDFEHHNGARKEGYIEGITVYSDILLPPKYCILFNNQNYIHTKLIYIQ